MSSLEVREATAFDALEFAGDRLGLRQKLPFQVRRCPSLIVCHEGQHVALVSFYTWRNHRVEFTMLVKPLASQMMLALIRLAHLTLCRFAHDGILVFAHIRSSDARAARMARLVGFKPAKFGDGSIWLFKG